MSSAVETFSPVSGAATNPYVHHSNFSIAAAAGAAGSPAAVVAAAAVMHQQNSNNNNFNNSSHNIRKYNRQQHVHQQQPYQQQHFLLQQQVQQQQQNTYNHFNSLQRKASASQHANISSHLNGAAFFLPPTTSSLIKLSESNTLPPVLVSKYSSQYHQPSRLTPSPERILSELEIDESHSMTSKEFAKPFPKQLEHDAVMDNCAGRAYANTNNNNVTFTNYPIPIYMQPSHGTSFTPEFRLPTQNLTSSLHIHDRLLNLNVNGKNSVNLGHAPKPITSSKYSKNQPDAVNLATTYTQNNNNHGHSNVIGTPSELIDESLATCSLSKKGIIHDVSEISTIAGMQLKNISNTIVSEAVTSIRLGSRTSKPLHSSQPLNTNITQSNAIATTAVTVGYQYPHLYASRGLYGPASLFSGIHNSDSNTLQSCSSYLCGSSSLSQQQQQEHHQHAPFPSYLQRTFAGVYSARQSSEQSPQVPTGSMIALCPSQLASQIKNSTTSILHNGLHPNFDANRSQITSGTLQVTKQNSLHERLNPQSSSIKDACYLTGTCFEGKPNQPPSKSNIRNGFKVPSGKEGSLKHRILIRPSTCLHGGSMASSEDRKNVKLIENRIRSSIAATVVRSSSTTNFTKGSCIELENGILRRVEDMKTEDFIQSAERSLQHELVESTVIKMNLTQRSVIITFNYDKNRPKADVEVPLEHPLFVYGQGWASCRPEMSLKTFGLKCRRLKVGDICILLISKQTSLVESPVATLPTNFSSNSKAHLSKTYFNPSKSSAHLSDKIYNTIQNMKNDIPPDFPRDLCKKVHSSLQEHHSSDMSSNVKRSNIGPHKSPEPSQVIGRIISVSSDIARSIHPHILHHSQKQPYLNEFVSAYENKQNSQISGASSSEILTLSQSTYQSMFPKSANNLYRQHQLQHGQQVLDRIISSHVKSDFQSSLSLIVDSSVSSKIPPQSMSEPIYIHSPSHAPSHNHLRYLSPTDGGNRSYYYYENNNNTRLPFDASLSRKRRWSAPESICNEDQIKLEPKQQNNLFQPLSRLF